MLRSSFYLLTFAVLPGLLAACGSTAPVPETAEVIYTGRPEEGTLSVRAVGYGDDVAKAVRHAEESAFKALLFRGIPGSTQANAMVEHPSDQMARHTGYFNEFFAGGRYATFMTESYLASDPERSNGLRRVVVALTINQNALRRDLERHGVIRSFGL